MVEQLQVSFDLTINNKKFTLILPYAAPFDDAFSALNSFYEHIKNMHNKAIEEQKKNEAANEGE